MVKPSAPTVKRTVKNVDSAHRSAVSNAMSPIQVIAMAFGRRIRLCNQVSIVRDSL
jgi:hypothetical protein